MPKLTIFLSGSDMTWEDTAFFLHCGAKKNHNLKDKTANHYYYFFNGPAASTSPEHKPVEKIEFDETKEDFLTAEPRASYNLVKHVYQLGHGSGMDHIVRAAYRLIQMAIKNKITEIDLIGFSRGGCSALSVGALLTKLETTVTKKELSKVTIIAIDPVAGLSRNSSANKYGSISSLVSTCIVALAVNESLPGFKPRGFKIKDKAYNVKFKKETNYIFLPLPEDHLMTNLWIQDLVREHIPSGSDLHSPCDERWLIERRLNLTTLKFHDEFGDTAAFRMVRYLDDKLNKDPTARIYPRHIFPLDEKKNINLRSGIEEFFKHIHSAHSKKNIGPVSLQNDADSEVKNRFYTKLDGTVKKVGHAHPEFKKIQQLFSKRNQNSFFRAMGARDRHVKEKLHLYTNHLFVNLLHEAMFQQSYPYLHQLLLTWNIDHLPKALAEHQNISDKEYKYTKDNIKHALMTGIQLRHLETFIYTNIKSYTDILKIAINTDSIDSKETKTDEIKITAHASTDIAAYCFSNILVFATDLNAKFIFMRHAQQYLQDASSLKILADVYKTRRKELPAEFLIVPASKVTSAVEEKKTISIHI